MELLLPHYFQYLLPDNNFLRYLIKFVSLFNCINCISIRIATIIFICSIIAVHTEICFSFVAFTSTLEKFIHNLDNYIIYFILDTIPHITEKLLVLIWISMREQTDKCFSAITELLHIHIARVFLLLSSVDIIKLCTNNAHVLQKNAIAHHLTQPSYLNWLIIF